MSPAGPAAVPSPPRRDALVRAVPPLGRRRRPAGRAPSTAPERPAHDGRGARDRARRGRRGRRPAAAWSSPTAPTRWRRSPCLATCCTAASRRSSSPARCAPPRALGADGPANLFDAVVVAGAPGAAGPRRPRRLRGRGPRRAGRPQDRLDGARRVRLTAPGADRARAGGSRVDGAAARSASRPCPSPRSTRPSTSSRPPSAPTARWSTRRSRPVPTGSSASCSAPATPRRRSSPPAPRGRARAGRGHRPARARLDPARHLRVRGRRARPARRRPDLRRRPDPRRGADQAHGLPRRRLHDRAIAGAFAPDDF